MPIFLQYNSTAPRIQPPAPSVIRQVSKLNTFCKLLVFGWSDFHPKTLNCSTHKIEVTVKKVRLRDFCGYFLADSSYS